MTYPLVKPGYYRSLLKDVVAFLKRPHLEPRTDKSTRFKVYDTIGLYVLKIVALVPVALFFALVHDPENVQSASMAERFSPAVLLLLAGLVLPFFEEVGFRLSLVFRPTYLAVTASVLTYYVLTKAVYGTKISMVDESFAVRVAVSGLLGVVLFPLLRRERVADRVSAFWAQHFRVIFYLSCVVFAWMHITKYEVTLTTVLLLPILTLPQLFSAVIYGYTRVAFGFGYPLALHVTMNSVVVSLSLLSA
ncbi:hypothetical protein [Rubrivirga sp. IMCC45206]|uniref:hypothetical protein n=1 Tax=Rubrivirga sp. IMCC45206 TaxID=3391614 RepID=UPI00398FB2B9